MFCPLTFPITAGPGAIVVMITLSAHASAERGVADLAAHGGIALAIAVLSITVFLCYGFAPTLRGTVSRCCSRRLCGDLRQVGREAAFARIEDAGVLSEIQEA